MTEPGNCARVVYEASESQSTTALASDLPSLSPPKVHNSTRFDQYKHRYARPDNPENALVGVTPMFKMMLIPCIINIVI
jgi:hypothetical protein